MTKQTQTRRKFLEQTAGLAAAAVSSSLPLASAAGPAKKPFRLTYILASCMYGKLPLATILPEVHKTGAEYIEIWAERHGNQREQIDQMGVEAFARMLREHNVKLGSFTCFKLGIFRMQPEMRVVKQLGGDMVICNSGGPRGLTGRSLKDAVRQFAEKLKPHVAAAEEIGVTIGVENHSHSLIDSSDSQLWLLEFLPSPHLGIALAPYHMPQDEQLLARHIKNLGERLVHFQAWQHGKGCMKKLPKEEELLQLPGRGPLDFTPLLAALKAIQYRWRTEIFMHPVPRGIPILPTVEQVTAEINRARAYLEECLARV
ncbi:MAG: sugar phosphate isomerase/epimerase [Planctomycetes bacterium]|nr:sugar phosphate isomerase/epimerase [Planctomycetota bacterium]